MKRPDDIVPSMIEVGEERELPGGAWSARMKAYWNPAAHAESCDVYWGSHGCARPRGHEGDHWCDCCDCEDHPDYDSGCVAGPPYYGPDTRFYGNPEPER